MKQYESEKIRNVAILGHSGSGKSNLIEAIQFTAGLKTKISKPTDPITLTSSMALHTVEYNENRYNILDTPGYFDFLGEVVSAMGAAGEAVIMVDGTTDLQVGTDKALEITDEFNIPKIIFVNKIDSDKADYDKILDQLRERYGKKIAPFHIPWGKGDEFKGFINVVGMYARDCTGKDFVNLPVPEDYTEIAKPVREMLLESVAESDDVLMDKYFNGEEFTHDEIWGGLRKGVINGDIIPVVCGSTAKNIGVETLLESITDFMPSPNDNLTMLDSPNTVVHIFKTVIDPFIGRISYGKILAGELKGEVELFNVNQESKERVSKLYTMVNQELKEISGGWAGDIVIFTKLADTHTGDTLSTSASQEPVEALKFPKPQMLVAIEPVNKGDEDKISTGLQRLLEEDPSFVWKRNAETKQTVLGVQGEIHVNSLQDKLKSKFGVEVELHDLKVPYRETIKGKSDVQGKHKKQSGGHGQYGDVKIRFEHCESHFEFTEEIFGGSVPKSYIPAVEKGLEEAMQHGILAGYPVTNIKATLYDGSYHDVDSSEMAFKLAANIAFKKGMEEAKPILLEPVMNLSIVVPEEYMGDVIGDINKKRGKVLGMEAFKNNKEIIYAQAPQSETFKYAIDLRAMTQGRGYFEMEVDHYEEVPEQLTQKIIENAKKEQ